MLNKNQPNHRNKRYLHIVIRFEITVDAMAIPKIELRVAQLLHFFYWRVEGDPSKLDMTETTGISISRQNPLLAFPTLRTEIF